MILASRVDLAVTVVYMLLMIAVGVVLSLFNRDEADFFRSGNKMPWWLSGFSVFMSSFSVWTFTGAAGLAYRAPGAAFAMYLTTSIGMVFAVWPLAGLWRRSRSETILSYLTERYGLSTNQTYSYTLLLATLVQAGIQLLALGKFISVAFGTDLVMTIIVCGVVISIYCLTGGLWAVAVTDTLQFMVLFPVALVVAGVGLYRAGGIGAVVSKLPEGVWQVKTLEFDWWYVLAFGVMMVFAMNSGSMAQRYYSVKNEHEARKVAVLAMVLLAVAPFLWFLPPILARVQGLDLKSITLGLAAPEEASYVGFCLYILPHGAIGVLLAGMMAATMSSLSATFNAYAGVITGDVVKQVFWKAASGRALLFIGRIATLVFGALVIAAAIAQSNSAGGVFGLMMTFSGVMIMPSGIPIVCGLFWKSTPPWAAIASYAVGVAVGVIFLALDVDLSFTQQVFIIGGISAAVYFIPGLLLESNNEYSARVARFFAKIARPVSPGEVGDTSVTDPGSLRITGWTTVLMGVGAASLALLDLPAGQRLINFAVGAAIAAFGAILMIVPRFLPARKTGNGT